MKGNALRNHPGGFTLVELMIVVAIIAIIAAIAIPRLLRARLAANETSAIGTLRNIVGGQATWQQSDTDGNALPDYWTGDVFGLHACATGSGQSNNTPDIAIGKSDRDNQSATAGAAAPRPYYSVVFPAAPVPKSGYLTEALVNDVTGAPYVQDGADGDAKALENMSRFGFLAVPQTYGSSGVNCFIVNEEGVIYARDQGATPAVNTQIWPAVDPTTAPAPWRVVQ